MRILYATVFALAAGSVQAQPQSPIPPSKPAPCASAPANWKLSKQPTTFEDADKNLSAINNRGWSVYKKTRRTNDLIREFTEARMRGYAVFRGACLHSFFVTSSK